MARMHPPERSFLRALVSLVVLVVVATACSNSTPAAPNAAASVGGSDITMAQLATTAAVFQSLASLQQTTCGQVDGETDTPAAACNRFSLGAMIQFRMAETYADANAITVDDAKVQKALDAFEKNVGADVLSTQLAASGATLEDVRELVRLSLVQEAVAKAVTADQLGEPELQKRYQQQIADYTTLHVDHILVDSKAQAEQIYQQVTAPGSTLEDFQALAKKVSTDPNAKKDGGELTLPATQLGSEFSDAALQLKPGEISKPVHTQYGWHVIYMIDKQVTPFDQARDKIVSQASTKAFQDWVQSQAGEIQVDPSFGRFDPATLQVQRITSTDPSATQPPPSGAVNGASATP
jgi:parvulin-like peptidyl-prolyl isomerase